MEIRKVVESDVQLLRDLHLRMYADSPDGFSETPAAARAMPTERWQGRAAKLADGGRSVGFLAIEKGQTVGFIVGLLGRFRDGGIVWDDVGETVTLARAWVDPAMRRMGVGQALAEAVISWAQEKRARVLEIQVTENNTPAIEFYQKLGFADTGRREPLLSNPALEIHFLSRHGIKES